MISHEIPSYPWQLMSMDFFLMDTKGVKKTFLISVDHYSDNIEFDQLNDLKPSPVIKACQRSFRSNGISEVICTDNGTNFINKEMKDFFKNCF